MPVNLHKIPPPAVRPEPPRTWLWISFLLLLLILGLGGAVLFGADPAHSMPGGFWGLALGLPTLFWGALSFGRLLFYLGHQAAANGWDEARDEDMISMIGRGRRSQQVLGVSLHTALEDQTGESGAQLDALLSGAEALKARPSRVDGGSLRHTRLAADPGLDLDAELLGVFSQTLAALVPALARLPDDRPLGLLLEVESCLPPDQWYRVWRQAWCDSGIRQLVLPVESGGLAALDQWLDQRIRDQALLLVIAVQFAPAQPEETAEVAVGLLLGNRLTQTTLTPLAYLHRPEQERMTKRGDLLYATRQALDWVPLDAGSVERTWRVGIDAQRNAAVTAALGTFPMPAKREHGVCDLDASLGQAGVAAPWLAIAAAAQSIKRGAGPQFIFSGGGAATAGLWGTVLTPVSPLSKQE